MDLPADAAHESSSTAIFLLTYLFLSVKLWCKPYFNGLVSKSSLDRLITRTLYGSFFLLLFLFDIGLCGFLFLHWSCFHTGLLLFIVRRMFLLMLLYSKGPTCWNIVSDKCLWQFSKYCKFFLQFNKSFFKTPSSSFIWSLDSINWPLPFAKVCAMILCNELCINPMFHAVL